MEMVISNSEAEVDARTWLNAHKDEEGLSWPQIGKLTDVSHSTLSLFATGKYAGRNDTVAAKVLAYRDRLAAQAEIAADVATVPVWYDTPTATKLTSLLRWAQSGKIVLIVTGPGIGKTRTAERFADADPNVWLATMAPSTAGVATMLQEVAVAVGLGEIKGSPQQLSRRVRAHIQGKKGLLIVDEAQELTDKALNELRGLHDRTGWASPSWAMKRWSGRSTAARAPWRRFRPASPSSTSRRRRSPVTWIRCSTPGDNGRRPAVVPVQDRRVPRRAARSHEHDRDRVDGGGRIAGGAVLDRLRAAARQRNSRLGHCDAQHGTCPGRALRGRARQTVVARLGVAAIVSAVLWLSACLFMLLEPVA